MKNNKKLSLLLAVTVISACALTACGQPGNVNQTPAGQTAEDSNPAQQQNKDVQAPGNDAPASAAGLSVRFGDDGEAFTLRLLDNDTAATLTQYLGVTELRLPIYHFDDYENWEVMQYYDIPGQYEIPSSPETVSSQKAGEVYFAEPNRIVLFYHDAEISGEFTKIGDFEPTEDFINAVENNPVLEGWGNKIISIGPIK